MPAGLVCITSLTAVARRLFTKRVFLNTSKIYKKAPVSGSFFNKVAGLRPASLLKRNSDTGAFLWILQNF